MFEKPVPQTRIAMVVEFIHQRIAARHLATGARLPSLRSMAKSLDVSVSTIVEAYDRLVADGTIISRPGSGFFVSNRALAFAVSHVEPKLDRAIDPFWVSRQSLEADPTSLKPGCGWLPGDWMPNEAIRRALRALSKSDSRTISCYGHPLGLPSLRHLIARRAGEKEIIVSPDQILITSSGTQAIDLVCRLLLEAGDTVVVDDPCYFNFQALLKAHRANVVSVPYTANGPDLAQFAEVMSTYRPRLYITNSGVHNPTGATLSATSAHRILKIAEQYDLTIIEDDIFADFEHRSAVRLAAFDGLQRVIHIGSFSKMLSASMRCGFIATRPDWMEDLINLSVATSFGGGHMNSELVFHVLNDPLYRKQMDGLRQRLSQKKLDVSRKLEKLGILPWLMPEAGLFLWCELPEGLDSTEIAQQALKENIVLAPGNAFSVSQSASRFMRFNVAQMEEAKIYSVLGNLIEGRRGRPLSAPSSIPRDSQVHIASHSL